MSQNKTLRKLFSEKLSPCLKELGFKKKNLNFYREDNNHILIVTGQQSHGRFFINLGVSLKCYDDFIKYFKKDPQRAEECVYDCRIGNLIKGIIFDKHWNIYDNLSEEEASDVIEDVWRDFSTYAVPWINLVSTPEGFMEFLESEDKIVPAKSFLYPIILLCLGQKDKSIVEFETEYKNRLKENLDLIKKSKKGMEELDHFGYELNYKIGINCIEEMTRHVKAISKKHDMNMDPDAWLDGVNYKM